MKAARMHIPPLCSYGVSCYEVPVSVAGNLQSGLPHCGSKEFFHSTENQTHVPHHLHTPSPLGCHHSSSLCQGCISTSSAYGCSYPYHSRPSTNIPFHPFSPPKHASARSSYLLQKKHTSSSGHCSNRNCAWCQFRPSTRLLMRNLRLPAQDSIASHSRHSPKSDSCHPPDDRHHDCFLRNRTALFPHPSMLDANCHPHSVRKAKVPPQRALLSNGKAHSTATKQSSFLCQGNSRNTHGAPLCSISSFHPSLFSPHSFRP